MKTMSSLSSSSHVDASRSSACRAAIDMKALEEAADRGTLAQLVRSMDCVTLDKFSSEIRALMRPGRTRGKAQRAEATSDRTTSSSPDQGAVHSSVCSHPHDLTTERLESLRLAMELAGSSRPAPSPVPKVLPRGTSAAFPKSSSHNAAVSSQDTLDTINTTEPLTSDSLPACSESEEE